MSQQDDYNTHSNYPTSDELLKTIHMPLNLSQLQTVLPWSKYDLTTQSLQADSESGKTHHLGQDRQSIISIAQ